MNKVKKISAIIGIIAILSMYLVSMIVAIFASEKAPGLFLASVFMTVIIPIMIYCFVTVYQRVHKDDNQKNNITDDTDTDN